jgi:hypothetical protein
MIVRKASRFRFAPRTFDFRFEIFFGFPKKANQRKVSVLFFFKSQFGYGFTVIQGKTD